MSACAGEKKNRENSSLYATREIGKTRERTVKFVFNTRAPDKEDPRRVQCLQTKRPRSFFFCNSSKKIVGTRGAGTFVQTGAFAEEYARILILFSSKLSGRPIIYGQQLCRCV